MADNTILVEVSAALIWDNNKFLICQRPAHKGNALLWEFVGGKAEAGENLQEALIRECMEELGVFVSVADKFIETEHQYPDIKVHLTVFNAQIVSGIPKLIEHNDMKWITPDEIDNYPFCPADKVILDKIKLSVNKMNGMGN